MKNLKNFLCKCPIIDFIVIAIIIIVFSFIFSNHIYCIFMDRGREFLFPQEILNGKLPYKDILMIYFPTSYYINALIYKILGVSINSLIISQTFFCICFMYIYYLCTRIFLDRKASIILSLLVISSCIFCEIEIFSFIVPYSYGRAFGTMSFILSTFLFIKLFKTNNLLYLYAAALTCGFCFIFKFEFFIVYILLALVLFIYNKLKPIQYLKVFILSIIFPILLLVFLFTQGVRVNDIIQIILFGSKFSSTHAMFMYLSEIGMYPFFLERAAEKFAQYTPYLISIILLSFAAWKLQIKYSKQWILPLTAVLIVRFFFDKGISETSLFLPYLILFVFCFKFKEMYSRDKSLIIISAATLLLAQREFFINSLELYGTFSFPLLILVLYIIIKEFLPEYIYGIKTEKFTNYILIILVGIFIIILGVKNVDTCFQVKSNKGTIYTYGKNYYIFSQVLKYINDNTDKNNSILVLPEGQIFNYLTDRKVNMKCHMMDRLYHDAYGQEKARDMIEATNSDYIIILHNTNLHYYYNQDLYIDGESLSYDYIDKHYTLVQTISGNFEGYAYIYKKIK